MKLKKIEQGVMELSDWEGYSAMEKEAMASNEIMEELSETESGTYRYVIRFSEGAYTTELWKGYGKGRFDEIGRTITPKH